MDNDRSISHYSELVACGESLVFLCYLADCVERDVGHNRQLGKIQVESPSPGVLSLVETGASPTSAASCQNSSQGSAKLRRLFRLSGLNKFDSTMGGCSSKQSATADTEHGQAANSVVVSPSTG